MRTRPPNEALDDAREEFLRVWADLGPAWGVNRTMSQIHALTMVARDSLNTDEIMAELPSLLKGLLAVCLGVVLFGAVATAFGTMIVGHPFVVNMIYLLVAEVGIALIPGWTKLASMTVHLRATAGLYKPQTSMFSSDPQLSASVSLPVVLCMAAVWLVIAVAVATTTEYRSTE